MSLEVNLQEQSDEIFYPQFGTYQPKSLMTKTEEQKLGLPDVVPSVMIIGFLSLMAIANEAWIVEHWQLLLHHFGQ